MKQSPALIAITSFAILALLVISFRSKKSSQWPMAKMLVSASITPWRQEYRQQSFLTIVSDVKSVKFYIQQDWDPNNRKEIDPSGEYFTTVYYSRDFTECEFILMKPC